MDSDSLSSAPRGDTNIANIGAGAHIDQIALGSNITQIKGATLEEVRVHLAQMYASYQRKPFDGRSPYVGLASFQEQDADRFFGREKLTQELVARIETARFLVIAGPSGSGKSSLARAGLMHTLRGGVQLNAPTNISTGTENWLYEILTPGRSPLTELARVVSSFTKSLNAGDEIAKRGRADETLLHRWADIALGDQKTRRAILLVDQFEEVFTQVTDESERAAFLNLLVYAATAENGRVTIICCTRSDFIGNWVKYPNLNDLLRHGLYQIPPMQPDELVSAIARPAIQVGLPIDETLVKEILDDMRAAPGALPLMQFALQDLFEYEKNQGGMIALTRDDYLARGGLHQALSRHADAAFSKLNPAEQKIARSIFASLVEPGRGNVDTRRTALLEEIVSTDADAAQVKNVITKLADARLVTTDKSGVDETITLAHERLIDAWKWLRDLIDENREAIALQNQINDDAKEWEQHERDASYLYTGARLASVQEKTSQKQLVLGSIAKSFVEMSITVRQVEREREAERQRAELAAANKIAIAERTARRRLTYLAAVLGMLLLGALIVLARPIVLSWLARGQMIWISGGSFRIGDTSASAPAIQRAASWTATLPSFQIEKYEVTNRQYRLCFDANICSEPQQLDFFTNPAKQEFPVVGVSLAQAERYCEWIERRLPTELEWEWAARGKEDLLYTTETQHPNAKDINVENYDDPTGDGRRPVREVAIDRHGTYGMAGNVSEWTLSYALEYDNPNYLKFWYPNAPPAALTDFAVARGGTWRGLMISALVTQRYQANPNEGIADIGIRCVQASPPLSAVKISQQ